MCLYTEISQQTASIRDTFVSFYIMPKLAQVYRFQFNLATFSRTITFTLHGATAAQSTAPAVQGRT